jgi:hypothetical protein
MKKPRRAGQVQWQPGQFQTGGPAPSPICQSWRLRPQWADKYKVASSFESGSLVPRLRFSLKTMFVVLVFLCLVGSNLITSYQLKQLHEENVALRKETGRLVIKDPAKLNVVAVPTYEDLSWRWRVHVPPGKGERISVSAYLIPQVGYSGSRSSTTLPPGDYLLTATVRRNHLDDWTLTIGHPGGTCAVGINAEHAGWLERQSGASGWSSSQAGQTEATVREPGAKLDLLRLRVMVQSSGGQNAATSDEPSDGLLIWTEDDK